MNFKYEDFSKLEILQKIQNICEESDGMCEDCPFSYDGKYRNACIFDGNPEDWKLKINRKDGD